MCVGLCAPSIPEQADRYEETASEHQGQSELWPANTIVLFLEVAIDAIVEERGYLGSDDRAEAQRNVVQTGDAARFMVPFYS